MQNSCLRLIHGIRRYQAISYKLKETGWLSMKHRRHVHSACQFQKIIIFKTPPYLYNKIKFRTDVHNINIRHKNTISIPYHRTQQYKRSFTYQIAQVMNKYTTGTNFTQNKFRRFVIEKLGNIA